MLARLNDNRNSMLARFTNNTSDVLARFTASKDAALLSSLGASKGGIARAQSLSPKKRANIAKTAAARRWNQRGN